MRHSYEIRIQRVLRYIHDNPAGDLSLDRLADEAALSRFHWHRVFHAMTGETCAQAVRRLRLHRAAGWLVDTNWPVERIARQCGYPNLRSFSRLFKASYGLAPAAYRIQGRFVPPVTRTKSGDHKMFPVTIRSEPPRKIVGLPHSGAYPGIGATFEQLAAILSSRDLWRQSKGMAAVYFDDPQLVAESRLRSIAGVIWTGGAVPEGLQSADLTGGRTAVMTYKGPYSGIHLAARSLWGDWFPQSGEDPGDAPCYELYLNSPADTSPQDLETEICALLKSDVSPGP